MLNGRRILLIIGGGIAAYKSLQLIRELQKKGAEVLPVMTKSAAEFVTPLSVSALSKNKVFSDLFDLNDEAEMGHIELSRSSDLIIVAPATANLMAKMAFGLATDLPSTLLLATDTPVLIATAMNVRMWEHPATQNNCKTLINNGVHFSGPDEGDMACGEFGEGKMTEPNEIIKEIEQYFNFKNKKFKKLALGNIPMGKLATESDIATTVCFLASSASSMITGTSIVIDGGWTAQ